MVRKAQLCDGRMHKTETNGEKNPAPSGNYNSRKNATVD